MAVLGRPVIATISEVSRVGCPQCDGPLDAHCATLVEQREDQPIDVKVLAIDAHAIFGWVECRDCDFRRFPAVEFPPLSQN